MTGFVFSGLGFFDLNMLANPPPILAKMLCFYGSRSGGGAGSSASLGSASPAGASAAAAFFDPFDPYDFADFLLA